MKPIRTIFDHDAGAFLSALVLHGAIFIALWKAPPFSTHRGPQTVEIDVRKPPQPIKTVEKPPELPKPPPPPEQHMVKARRIRQPSPPQAPIPNETPKEPPKPQSEPPKPVFGVTMSSTTTGDSSFAVAVGNTTIADPKSTAPKGPVRPLAPAPPGAAPAPVFKAASPLEIRDWPDIDRASCEVPNRFYPPDLRDQGVEGSSVLRVEIDDQGKVHGVRVLSGQYKAFNDLAVQWMKTHCRFKPAKNTANKFVSAVINYTFSFSIER